MLISRRLCCQQHEATCVSDRASLAYKDISGRPRYNPAPGFKYCPDSLLNTDIGELRLSVCTPSPQDLGEDHSCSRNSTGHTQPIDPASREPLSPFRHHVGKLGLHWRGFEADALGGSWSDWLTSLASLTPAHLSFSRFGCDKEDAIS